MFDLAVLRGPRDVVAAVPAIIGFHPVDSVVLLWLSHETRTIECTMRLDLATPSAEIQRRIHSLAAHTRPGKLIMVAYPRSLAEWIDSADEDRLLQAGDELAHAGIDFVDFLIVCEGRYWSALCTDPGCCPIGGLPVPDAITEAEVVRVVSGHPAVAATREEVAASFTLRTAGDRSPELLQSARDGLPGTLAEACDLALELIATHAEAPLTDLDRARLWWLLQRVDVRDWALAHLFIEDPDLAAADLLVDLALTAPDDLRPRLAGAAAAALYACGASSVGVWSLIDQADGDSLAGLVAASLDASLPPTALRAAFKDALPLMVERLETDIPA